MVLCIFFLQVSQFGVCGYAFLHGLDSFVFHLADVGLGMVYESDCMNVHTFPLIHEEMPAGNGGGGFGNIIDC